MQEGSYSRKNMMTLIPSRKSLVTLQQPSKVLTEWLPSGVNPTNEMAMDFIKTNL